MQRLTVLNPVFGAVAAAALVLAACGDDDGGSTKPSWEKEHGDLVTALGRDIDDAAAALGRGERNVTLGACTQLSDDAQEVRSEALPVPDSTVDAALRRAVDLAAKAAASCIEGARNPQGGASVEAAQREITDARQAMNEAETARRSWR
jgi:hypothetical protein